MYLKMRGKLIGGWCRKFPKITVHYRVYVDVVRMEPHCAWKAAAIILGVDRTCPCVQVLKLLPRLLIMFLALQVLRHEALL
jgi:hypothetical protein